MEDRSPDNKVKLCICVDDNFDEKLDEPAVDDVEYDEVGVVGDEVSNDEGIDPGRDV